MTNLKETSCTTNYILVFHLMTDDDSSSDEEYGLQDELWHVDGKVILLQRFNKFNVLLD